MPSRKIDPLTLYRLAVQHPQAEVAFLARAYRHYARREPLLLREDFAGTAAVAAAWVARHEERQAMAVERHGPTLVWAKREANRELGERAGDLHFVRADVMRVTSPRVDVIAALNFSAFVYHDRAALVAYFRIARRSLRPGGVLVIDAYGGPGAMRVGEQRRAVMPSPEVPGGFEYRWEQRSYDAATGKVDCRIHFRGFRIGRRTLRDAFVYDWRLWTLPELTDAMRTAGLSRAEIWCDRPDRPGVYRPIKAMGAREDWVAYVVGVR